MHHRLSSELAGGPAFHGWRCPGAGLQPVGTHPALMAHRPLSSIRCFRGGWPPTLKNANLTCMSPSTLYARKSKEVTFAIFLPISDSVRAGPRSLVMAIPDTSWHIPAQNPRYPESTQSRTRGSVDGWSQTKRSLRPLGRLPVMVSAMSVKVDSLTQTRGYLRKHVV